MHISSFNKAAQLLSLMFSFRFQAETMKILVYQNLVHMLNYNF